MAAGKKFNSLLVYGLGWQRYFEEKYGRRRTHAILNCYGVLAYFAFFGKKPINIAGGEKMEITTRKIADKLGASPTTAASYIEILAHTTPPLIEIAQRNRRGHHIKIIAPIPRAGKEGKPECPSRSTEIFSPQKNVLLLELATLQRDASVPPQTFSSLIHGITGNRKLPRELSESELKEVITQLKNSVQACAGHAVVQ